jgi:hypothetical protein
MPTNDREFKDTLGGLSIARQRQVASKFVRRVFPLSNDFRIKAALDSAERGEITDAELATAYQGAKTAAVESYTQCGHECDWNSQAGHFVAQAAVACVRPVSDGENLAWEAAMHARMARTCESVASGEGTENHEAEAQYRILESFLNSQGIHDHDPSTTHRR